MTADGINYKDVLVIAKKNAFGALDVPFSVFAFAGALGNRIFYNIVDAPTGIYMLVNTHVRAADYETVMLNANVIKDYQNDARVLDYWTVKKSIGLGVKDENGVLVEAYDGQDKNDLMPFIPSGAMQ